MQRVFCLALSALAAFVASSTSLRAGFVNGSFENPALSPWVILGTGSQVTPSFDGELPTDAIKMAVIENATGALPVGILDFIVDATLGVGPGFLSSAYPTATEGSLLYQNVSLGAGESTVSFDWNFLTNEGPASAFNDFAFAQLLSGGSPVGSPLVWDTFTPFGGSGTLYFDHTGWNTASFSGLAAGSYTLLFGVFDATDGLVDSALLVDRVTTVPEPSGILLSGLAMGLVAWRRRRA